MTNPHTLDAPLQAADETRVAIDRATAILRAGGLVALPTETVYGLGADARNLHALKRIFAAKRRPSDHPLIVHIAAAAQLNEWCSEVPASAWLLAEAFWPGPLTLILRRAAHVLDAVTGGQDTVGLRVPAHPVALALLRAFAGGIAAPSANRFGHVSPTTAAHVRAELGSDVDMILDGGACAIGIESTIVDLTAVQPRVLRPGSVRRAQLESVLGIALPERPADMSSAPRVSGALASHYAPHTPVRWLQTEQLYSALRSASSREHLGPLGKVSDVGVVALSPADTKVDESAAADGNELRQPTRIVWRSLSVDPTAYARQLYAQLRELDELGLDLILLEVPPATAAWEAVRDRLRRAAGLG